MKEKNAHAPNPLIFQSKFNSLDYVFPDVAQVFRIFLLLLDC